MRKQSRTVFDVARDELMSHIHRCGVLKASQEQQDIWFDDTMDYMAERYPELSEERLKELREIGRRFCQPVIVGGTTASAKGEGAQEDEMAGAA
jgi:hypothetical protein